MRYWKARTWIIIVVLAAFVIGTAISVVVNATGPHPPLGPTVVPQA